MNRKAKVAYAHIIIGFILFLVGLVTIFNHTLNKNDDTLDDVDTDSNLNDDSLNFDSVVTTKKQMPIFSSDVGLKVNLSNILNPSSSGKDARPKLEYDQDEDMDIYIKRYCQMRRQKQSRSVISEEVTIGTGGAREVRSSDQFSTSRSALRSSSPSFLNNLFGFLICSTDTIYLIMIVCLALFGSLVLLYGCVRFYENDVRLINRNDVVDDSVTSRKFSQMRNDVEEDYEKNWRTWDAISCCLNLNSAQSKSSLRTLSKYVSKRRKNDSNRVSSPTTIIYDEIRSFDASKKQQFPALLLKNPFGELNESNDRKAFSNELEMQRRLAAAERMCPFIYDELPAFILEKKSDLIFDCSTLSKCHKDNYDDRDFIANSNFHHSESFLSPRLVAPQPPKQPPPPRPLPLSQPQQPKLPQSRPPKLNKNTLDNLIYSNHSLFLNDQSCNSNNRNHNDNTSWNDAESRPMYVQREPTKMYSLVIERENRCRMAEYREFESVNSKSKQAGYSSLQIGNGGYILASHGSRSANAFNGQTKTSVQFSKNKECFL